jgi:hypothetical protein
VLRASLHRHRKRKHALRAPRQRGARRDLRAGRDVLRADTHTRDTDRLYGNRGKDTLTVDDGDMRDTVSGGPGFDVCIADTTAEIGGGCERVRAAVLPPPEPIVD